MIFAVHRRESHPRESTDIEGAQLWLEYQVAARAVEKSKLHRDFEASSCI